jgi:hypothetical protein
MTPFHGVIPDLFAVSFRSSFPASFRSPSPVSFRSAFPLSFRAPLPCPSERPSPVSFRAPLSRVIPNAPLPCHSERSEESAVGNTAGNGARLKEIPRRCTPRNDTFSQCHPGSLCGLLPELLSRVLPKPFSRVIPNVVRNLQLGIRRETVQNSRRFLVATLLGMTAGGLGMTGWTPRNDRMESCSERRFSRCHSERLPPVSFRTPLSRVIPERLSPVIPSPSPVSFRAPLPCHSERSEESAVGNTAGNGARLKEIPRRCTPRNDTFSRCHPGSLCGVLPELLSRVLPKPFSRVLPKPFSRVIPNVVRNLQLGIRRETVQNSRRFLVATLLGMTAGGLEMTGWTPRNDRMESCSERRFSRCHSERLPPVSFRAPFPCHSEPLSRVIPNVVRNLQLGIRRETVQNSRRFLVVALLGMTPFPGVIPDLFAVSFRSSFPASFRSPSPVSFRSPSPVSFRT